VRVWKAELKEPFEISKRAADFCEVSSIEFRYPQPKEIPSVRQRSGLLLWNGMSLTAQLKGPVPQMGRFEQKDFPECFSLKRSETFPYTLQCGCLGMDFSFFRHFSLVQARQVTLFQGTA